ncbi:hypothetical protein AB1Y20_009469 [Prymnesium parvum]|uniref:Uncharacterized protein n=1 Tax=Prymnesium parvum TaxID=97485 RepID=A0AB34K0D3_PRYPA
MATPRDFARYRAEAQLTIDFYAEAVQVLLALEPTACVLHGFGHPGGGAQGSQNVGMPVVILDNATSAKGRPEIGDSVRWFGLPSNQKVPVHVVYGDALIREDTPPCTPVSNMASVNSSRRDVTSSNHCFLTAALKAVLEPSLVPPPAQSAEVLRF